jgi:hypothetical protein
MRRVVLLVLAVMLTMTDPTSALAGTVAQAQTVLDKTFTLDPNNDSRTAFDCFEVPYGVMLTVVAMTFDEDTGGEQVSLVLKEGDITRLRTSLTTNPTVMVSYAGAGTYCYWIGASHVHLDTIAPVRQARLIITADGGTRT